MRKSLVLIQLYLGDFIFNDLHRFIIYNFKPFLCINSYCIKRAFNRNIHELKIKRIGRRKCILVFSLIVLVVILMKNKSLNEPTKVTAFHMTN
jgi:hypothetical protein